MLRSKKTKTSFKRDEKGRVVLGSAKDGVGEIGL